MPAKLEAIVESPDDDGLGELNEEYQGGEWAVVNLASLQSIPLSDYSHSPYGQGSNYLDTFSVSAFSTAPSARPAVMQVEASQVSPMVPFTSGKPAIRKQPPNAGSSRPSLGSTSPHAVPLGASNPSLPDTSTAGRPTARGDKESSRALATLVRRELTKRTGEGSSDTAPPPPGQKPTIPTKDAGQKTTTTTTTTPPQALASPRVGQRRPSIEANRQAAVPATDVVSSTAAAEASTKLWTNQRARQQRRVAQPRRPLPQPPPMVVPLAPRPLAQTVDMLQSAKLHREEDSPTTVATSMRELTNARRMPVNGDDDENDGVCNTSSRPPTASASNLSDLMENSATTKPKPGRRQHRWRAVPPPASRRSPSEDSGPGSGRGSAVQLAEFSPLPSQRGESTQNSTRELSGDTSNDQTRNARGVGAGTVPRRSSRRTSVSVPSVASTLAGSPPPSHSSEQNSTSNSNTAKLSASQHGTGDASSSKRRPLLPPRQTKATAASLAASNGDLQSPVVVTVPTTRERAATASEERLVAFVRAVSDPEVLHVIRDYINEKEGAGRRQYCEAARICDELLQKKEKLLEDVGARERGRTRNSSRRRPNRALLPGDNEEEETHRSGGYGKGSEGTVDSLADEFDDLNFVDSPYPDIRSDFQFGEPTVVGTVSRVFKEGLLFKIKDSRGDYYFYNDTLNQVMMIRTQCVLLGNERINERALLIPSEADSSVTEITIAVLPEETNFLMGNCKRLPRIMAKAIVTPDDFVSPSVTKFMTSMNGEINKVRAALGQWSKATDQRAYLKCCLKNKLKFTDLQFRPCVLSLYRPLVDEVKIPALTWRRPEEYLALTEVAETRLFRGEISCHLVKQGELSDHTVVAAIAAIAQYPHHVMWLFRHPTNGEAGKRERAVGCYRVTLLQNGWWTTFLLDDYVPASVKGPLFAHCPVDPRRLWVPMLEKAYAKATGSYSAICLADVLDVLADFTGFPVRSIDTQWLQAQAKPAEAPSVTLFRYLQRCVANGYLVLLYTPSARDEQSTETVDLSRRRSQRMVPVDGVLPQFLPGHVYFLSDAAHYTELDLRMVRLKNPWTWETANSNTTGPDAATVARQKHWKYSGWYQRPDQSFASTLSAASVTAGGGGAAAARAIDAQACDEEEERKGTMWLEWTEALRAFAGGGVCYTVWDHAHYRVHNSFNTGYPDFVLEVTPVRAKVELFLSITVEAPDSGGPVPAQTGKAATEEPTKRRKKDAQELALCGVTLTVAKRARKPLGRSTRNGAGGKEGQAAEEEEEVCAMACDDVECVGAKTTYVRAKTVSLRVSLEPHGAPYHIIPQLDPDDAHALRKRGETQVPFVLGILSSAPVGADDVGVHFKRIPRTCAVFGSDMKRFTINAAASAPFTTTYQYCHEGGVTTAHGEHIAVPSGE